MQIHIKEPGSEAFYRETVSVMNQYRALLKDPEMKIKDLFSQTQTLFIVSVIMFLVVDVMGISWGFSTTVVIAAVLLGIGIIMSLLIRSNLNRALASLMQGHSEQTLTLDEQGIELRKADSKRVVRVPWEDVAFARIFSESVCFLATGSLGIVFSVSREYEEQVVSYLEEKLPELRLIK